jgi:hypothetical protein
MNTIRMATRFISLGTLLFTMSVTGAPGSSTPCGVASPTLARLAAGDERTVRVCARPHWNHTGIAVKPGEVYELTAHGSWSDASHTVTAAGYEIGKLAPFRPFRRRRDAPWFELIGALGESERSTFRIGEHASIPFDASGELVLYANDASFMYWNNCGSIDVVVRRVR